MNSLKRHKQANKTKDTIIMTKYNIVKIFQRRLPPENQVYGQCYSPVYADKNTGISMADGTASRANASGVAAGLHSTARVNISIPIL